MAHLDTIALGLYLVKEKAPSGSPSRPRPASIVGGAHWTPTRGRPLRVLFAFTPERTALLLVGGDKSGQPRWYERAIRQAEAAFWQHIESRHGT